jgi:hypothetical protein
VMYQLRKFCAKCNFDMIQTGRVWFTHR